MTAPPTMRRDPRCSDSSSEARLLSMASDPPAAVTDGRPLD
jgi:hypothetical protein